MATPEISLGSHYKPLSDESPGIRGNLRVRTMGALRGHYQRIEFVLENPSRSGFSDVVIAMSVDVGTGHTFRHCRYRWLRRIERLYA